jgi:hypothetical protein
VLRLLVMAMGESVRASGDEQHVLPSQLVRQP